MSATDTVLIETTNEANCQLHGIFVHKKPEINAVMAKIERTLSLKGCSKCLDKFKAIGDLVDRAESAEFN